MPSEFEGKNKSDDQQPNVTAPNKDGIRAGQSAENPGGSGAGKEVQTIGGVNNGKPGETAQPKPNGQTCESAQRATQPTVKPDGSAGSKETQTNLGGGIFDPARRKTSVDARLDPKAKIQPASYSKIEVRKPPADFYVRVRPDPAYNGLFPLYAATMAKRYDPYLIAPDLDLPQ